MERDRHWLKHLAFHMVLLKFVTEVFLLGDALIVNILTR